MSISLSEITKKIGDAPTVESLMNLMGEYDEYVKIIDSCATEVFSNVSPDDLKTALDIIRSVAIADALGDGVVNGSQLRFLLSDDFAGVAAVIFKLSVGLAVVEEMR